MSTEETQPMPPLTPPVKTTVSTRMSAYLSARRNSMFGVAEIMALGVSCLIFVLVLFSYLYFLIPARSQTASLTAERTQLQTNLIKSRQILTNDNTTQETVRRIIDSLNNFETVSLQRQEEGRMELYDQLNQLMVKNSLRNTSGPTYTPLDPSGSKTTPGKSTNTKYQTAYPGIAVAVTVEGPYQNLRQFIKDIERSKQFVIIYEIELQRAQNDSSQVAATESGSGTRGSLVSLQLSMATYFQRVETSALTSQEQ
ncbi:MAG TPA: GspMb/PilO family protein [Pyrinomonadaceae bacterium]|nr:GspMb/PilO family protein [Pyrinomonadaceae bacterium]